MKLYFYVLRKKLEVIECEALKNGGLIKPVQGFFPIGRGNFIIEPDIGIANVDKMGGTPYVILKAPDMEKAKQLLINDYINKKIEVYKQNIERMEEKRKIIENTDE